jgi:hypothetical protein
MIVAVTWGSGDPGPGTLATALAASRAVERGRIELVTTIAGPAGPVALVHRGAYDRAGGRAQAESDMSALADALKAAGQPPGGDGSHPNGVVVDGETLYSQLGPMAESLGREPTDWIQVQLMAVMAQGVTDNDALALALDPLGPLDLLERRVVEIGLVGEDTVRGTAARHLRASLALAGVTPDGSTEPSPASFEGRLQAAGVDVLPVDVWVDDGAVVRRLRVSLDDALGGAGGLSTTFELYDVDADVEIDVPHPDTIAS